MLTTPRRRHVREFFTSALALASAGMAAWTFYLGVQLPRHYVVHHWDLAWVGLDVMQTLMLLGTAWAAWRRRVIVVLFAIAAAVLFLNDAWFDVTTAGLHDLQYSVFSACFIEIPGAAVLLFVARRTVQAVANEWWQAVYQRDAPPPSRLTIAPLDDLERSRPHDEPLD